MNSEIPLLVIGFKTVTLLLGGFITYLATKAARKSGDRGLTYLALGFGIVTLGSLLAGSANQVFTVGTNTALVVESGLTMIGFSVIAYSLYATRTA
jgi:hypothetical protein